jgi:hypothetical protein
LLDYPVFDGSLRFAELAAGRKLVPDYKLQKLTAAMSGLRGPTNGLFPYTFSRAGLGCLPEVSGKTRD